MKLHSSDAAIKQSGAPPSDTPHRPLYFEDIVQIRRDAGRDSQEFLEARNWWVEEKFQAVHYEHYSMDVAAGVVEVTPRRPPYDYRGQQWQHLFHRKDPEWHYWRETFVSSPPDPRYVKLN